MSRTIRSVVLCLAFVLSVATAGFVASAQQSGAQATPPAGKPATDQTKGQQQPPGDQQKPQQPPTFKLPINFVRVDAIVTDKQGHAVPNLAADDFEVSENGKPQKVESFKFINVGNATEQQLNTTDPVREIRSDADEEAEAARDDVRISPEGKPAHFDERYNQRPAGKPPRRIGCVRRSNWNEDRNPADATR